MTEYDNTNKGVLFKNDRKERDNHPDYRGQININGQEFWLSAWIKTGQKGKFMSLSIQPKEQQRQAPPSRPAPQRAAPSRPTRAPARGDYNDDFSDEVPF